MYVRYREQSEIASDKALGERADQLVQVDLHGRVVAG